MAGKKYAINPPLNIYKKLVFSFIVLTLILLGVIFYFSFSYLNINIYPKAKEINKDFTFIVAEDKNLANAETGMFSGQISSQTLEGQKQFETTGTKPAGKSVVGQVKISNDSASGQTLIATTRLLAESGIIYRLKNNTSVPAKGSATVDVYTEEGVKDLAKAGDTFTIPGLNAGQQKLITGTAVNDFSASGTMITAISQEEMDAAVNALSDELIKQNIKPEDGQATIFTKQVTSKEFSEKVGAEVKNYTLKLKIKVSGVIFSQKAIADYAEKLLQAQTESGYQLISSDSLQLVYSVSSADWNNKIAQVKSKISGQEVITADNKILDRQTLGALNVDQLQEYLNNFGSDIEKSEISFFPSWVKKMPYFKDHIIIKIIK